MDHASWIRSLTDLKEGKSRLRILMVAATFVRFEWCMNDARMRTTLLARESTLTASGTCSNEAQHAELRGIFRQVYNVSLPTLRVKLDVFHLSKLIYFDAARRIPMLRQISQGCVRGVMAVQHMKLCIFEVAHCT